MTKQCEPYCENIKFYDGEHRCMKCYRGFSPNDTVAVTGASATAEVGDFGGSVWGEWREDKDEDEKIVQVSGFGVNNTANTQCDYMLVAVTGSGRVLMSQGDREWIDVSPKEDPDMHAY